MQRPFRLATLMAWPIVSPVIRAAHAWVSVADRKQGKGVAAMAESSLVADQQKQRYPLSFTQ